MEDSFLHKGLRKKLVEEIKRKGIKNKDVLEAIGKVPRHLFMDSSFVKFAYKDQAFPISSGQTISQPYTVAFQTELLDIKKGNKVLEIGTGSGYQAAVILEMGARVYSIERHKSLYLAAKARLPKFGYNPQLFYGDGYLGLPTYAPFDKLLITAAIDKIPEVLLEQLKVGGKLIAPVGSENTQHMTCVEKVNNKDFTKTKHGLFVFVPMLSGKA